MNSTRHSRASETARERELLRYLPKDLCHADGSVIRSSHDTSLTAFAQLGAVRMNAKRGIITLSTRKRKWIIAEAGQTLSLQDDSRHAVGDELWFGVGQDTRYTGLGLFNEYLNEAPSPGEEAPFFYVPDLCHDDRFKLDPDLKKDCFCSIVAAPIRSPSGIVIGLFGLIYDEPRKPVNECEVQFLTDMAKTVMDHLDAGRIKKKQYRSERMVKGIGLFVEGKSTLRDWWLKSGHVIPKKAAKTEHHLIQAANIEFGVQEPSITSSGHGLQGLQNVKPRVGFEDAPASPHRTASPNRTASSHRGSVGHSDVVDTSGRPAPRRDDSLFSSTTGLDSDPAAPVFTPDVARSVSYESTADTTVDSALGQQDMILEPIQPILGSPYDDMASGRRLQEALLSADLKNVFSRASNLIREAISLDGAVFFDASVGSFGGGSKKANAATAPTAFNFNGTIASNEPTSSSEDEKRKRDSGILDPIVMNPIRDEEESHDKHCGILGYSTRSRSSLNMHEPPDELLSCNESFLRKLLKRYPHGKVFSFEEDGGISSNEDTMSCALERPLEPPPAVKSSKKRKMTREAEASSVLALFPGSRSVAFFPLWDSTKNRWFAGSFMWTSSEMRPLCPLEDLTYMAAFGNSIMAEVARLNAVMAGQIKNDFISSISHELRSPLHGVLASVEFLQDTVMTEAQIDMVDTIQACGKTLLDTINHVLDFAKINKTVKSRPKKRKKGVPRKSTLSSSGRDYFDSVQAEKVDAEDICVLSEEVVHSIYAGHSLGKRQREGSVIQVRRGPIIPETQPVVVIVDVEWQPNWTFAIDAGAWRRVLMNLFSNAMKYTDAGYVRVQLKTEIGPLGTDGRPQSILSLTVSDSGKGISQEFLKHHLYTPFAQEDSLAVGTGLGLSIVRQIVSDLGGSISHTSEQGTGTEARVTIPLLGPIMSDQLAGDDGDIISEVRKKAKGLKACLVAFDVYPDMDDTPTGILSPEAESVIFLKSSISSIMDTWFDLETTTAPSLESAKGDILVLMESTIKGMTIEEQLQTLGSQHIVFVLCASHSQNANFVTKDGLQVFFIHQPYGPHKMAHILKTALMSRPKRGSHSLREALQNGHASSEHKPRATSLPATLPSLEPSSPTAIHDFALPKLVQGKISSNTSPNLPIRPPMASLHSSQTTLNSISTLSTTSTLSSNDPRRVLLVEDNEINLKILVTYMRKLQIAHCTAVNGLEALNAYIAAEGGYDVIFMDISMPVMDGLTASRKIREWEESAGIDNGKGSSGAAAIIALTGAATMSARQEAFSSGIDLFLTKPVPMKNLKGILEDLRVRGRDGLAE